MVWGMGFDDGIGHTEGCMMGSIAVKFNRAASVIANFGRVVKEGNLKLHPIVTRLVDDETLKKMGAERLGK